jgi:hypothetical protein
MRTRFEIDTSETAPTRTSDVVGRTQTMYDVAEVFRTEVPKVACRSNGTWRQDES